MSKIRIKMQFPNATEIINLLHEVEPTGTPADDRARGGMLMRNPMLLKATDYVLTAVYIIGYSSLIFWGLKTVIAWLPLLSK